MNTQYLGGVTGAERGAERSVERSATRSAGSSTGPSAGRAATSADARSPFARLLWALAAAASMLAWQPSSLAVDVPNRNAATEDRAMREARAAVKEKAWPRVLELLDPYVKAYPDDADAHNLLGFSLRHLGRYDHSLAAYDRALALDPGHLGAHEYVGELMLILGRRDRAAYHLGELERLCPSGCEELDELRTAIETDPQRTPTGR